MSSASDIFQDLPSFMWNLFVIYNISEYPEYFREKNMMESEFLFLLVYISYIFDTALAYEYRLTDYVGWIGFSIISLLCGAIGLVVIVIGNCN